MLVGSGENGLTFMIRRGNYLFQAPLSYYSKTKKWDFSPGYETVGSRLQPRGSRRVHQLSRRARLAGTRSAWRFRRSSFRGDGHRMRELSRCQGALTCRSLRKAAGHDRKSGKTAARLAENICMDCHQSGDARVLQPGKNFSDFHPGDWLFDTAVILKKPAQTREQQESDLLEHYSAMQASRCFRSKQRKTRLPYLPRSARATAANRGCRVLPLQVSHLPQRTELHVAIQSQSATQSSR